MLTSEIIKDLNTQNIAENKNVQISKFMIKYWDTASSQVKKKCIALGGYKDSRPFWQTKTTGKVSVRMVVSLSLGLSPRINPFFIVGESGDIEYSDIKLAKFLEQTGFKAIVPYIYDNLPSPDLSLSDKENELNFVVEEFRNMVKNSVMDLQNSPEISVDDLIILLKNLEIKSRISNDEVSKIKLKLVKLILFSN